MKNTIDEEISAIRWGLSVLKGRSSVAKLVPEVPLFVLSRFRLVRCGKVIRFQFGSWLELAVGSGATRYMFRQRSKELKILKDGLRDIAAKLDALAKEKYGEHQ